MHPSSFSEWLKQLRKARDWTQAELAAAVGCASITIGKLEAGTRRPARHMAERLAAVLRVPEAERPAFLALARATAAPDDADRSSLGPLTAPAHLPLPLTPLLGRETELAQVCQRLANPAVRLLTLIGPAGVGKTRLALACAHLLHSQFAQGVVWMPCAALSEPTQLVPALLQTLDDSSSGPEPALDRLRRWIGGRTLLLVLDNLEHLVSAGPVLVELLTTAPQLTILVTSRVVLRLSGEQTIAVQPLAVPPELPQVPADALAALPSVALFVQRAQAVDPSFALTQANAAAVATICRRLDGLPLALEVAAARMRVFTPQMLLDHLDEWQIALAPAARDLRPHQQTLDASLLWSEALLTRSEQLLFWQLSVFDGGWTLDAAVAVTASDDEPAAPQRQQLLHTLGGLIEQSLVQRHSQEPELLRYTMLETIRVYALAQLAQHGLAATAQQRHARYYLQLAETAEAQLLGPQQAAWLIRLDHEHANLRAAMCWAIDQEQPEIAARIASAIWRSWERSADLEEGRRWLETILQRRGALSALTLSKVLNGAGHLAAARRDYDAALVHYQACLGVRQALGDPLLVAAALNNLGHVAVCQGQLDAAERSFAASLALLRAHGPPPMIALSLSNLAGVALQQNRLERARQLAEASVSLQPPGDPQVRLLTAGLMGEIALQQGDDQQARRWSEDAVQRARQPGLALHLPRALVTLGRALCRQGLYDAARPHLREALDLSGTIDAPNDLAAALDGLAELASGTGDWARAARLWAGATQLRAAAQIPPSPLQQHLQERTLALLRQQFNPAILAQLWAQGQAMTSAELRSYALRDQEQRLPADGVQLASDVMMP